jgi:hypothetical protein
MKHTNYYNLMEKTSSQKSPKDSTSAMNQNVSRNLNDSMNGKLLTVTSKRKQSVDGNLQLVLPGRSSIDSKEGKTKQSPRAAGIDNTTSSSSYQSTSSISEGKSSNSFDDSSLNRTSAGALGLPTVSEEDEADDKDQPSPPKKTVQANGDSNNYNNYNGKSVENKKNPLASKSSSPTTDATAASAASVVVTSKAAASAPVVAGKKTPVSPRNAQKFDRNSTNVKGEKKVLLLYIFLL